jgi:hypothetical protein
MATTNFSLYSLFVETDIGTHLFASLCVFCDLLFVITFFYLEPIFDGVEKILRTGNMHHVGIGTMSTCNTTNCVRFDV